MHIVLVSKLSGHGGIAVYNRTLAKSLAEMGHQVVIVTSQKSDFALHELHDGVRLHGIQPMGFSWLRKVPWLGRYARDFEHLFYSYQVSRALAGIHQKGEIDLVECAEVGGEGCFYLRQKKRAPVVVRCHTPTVVLKKHHLRAEMPYSTWLLERMERFCIRSADLLTTPSRDMAEVISREFDVPFDQIHPVPNPVNAEEFTREKMQTMQTEKIIVLHVGRFERVKGIEVLANAIPLVVRSVPEIFFVFLGAARSDAYASAIKQRLEAAGEKNVEILGFVVQEEMLNWYHRADVAVVPSLNYESFSYTCAQAMAAGLPVVASRIGGIPETVDNKTSGLLVETGNVHELADGIILLAKDDNMRVEMGKKGAEKAHEKFNASVVAEQMLSMYEKIVP
jgi:glycosyltransferase involved in cell wall biosynthesis